MKTTASALPSYTRLNYALLFLLTASLSYLMLTDYIETMLAGLTLGYFQIKCGDGPCHGVIAVYRFCFASAVFHTILALVLSRQHSMRSSIQNGGWLVKVLGYVGLVVVAFFIPNGFFLNFRSWAFMPGIYINA